MIKIANNLNVLCGERTRTKQAFPGTIISALIHGAAADDDEPIFREILRGAGKGMGADLGVLLGGLTGLGVGGRLHGFDLDSTQPAEEVKGLIGSGALGGFAGAGLGGVGGYLLADKLIDSIGKKKQKSKNPGVKSAYAPPVSSGNDIRWMAGDPPYLQAGDTPATSLDPNNQMAQDRIDYLRTLAPNDPELANMDPVELASLFNTSLGLGQQAVRDRVRDATTPASGQGTTLAQFAGRHAQAAVPALVKNAPRIASGISSAANYLKNRFMPSPLPKPKPPAFVPLTRPYPQDWKPADAVPPDFTRPYPRDWKPKPADAVLRQDNTADILRLDRPRKSS